MRDLKGKTAVITGAGAKRSMGRAIAMQLAADGANVVVSDRFDIPSSAFEEDAGWGGLSQIAADIEALGCGALAVKTDVSCEADVAELFRLAKEKFGKIDIVVHCVGIRGPVPTPAAEMGLDVWQMMLNINLTGAFLVGREAARFMTPNKSGKIVLISSMAGLKAYPGSVAYGATKHGVLGIMKTLAAELGRHGINVNAICPGRFNTNFRDNYILEQASSSGQSVKEVGEKDQECPFPIWLGRSGTPRDISGVVSFLVSDAADYITGETIVVDGGSN